MLLILFLMMMMMMMFMLLLLLFMLDIFGISDHDLMYSQEAVVTEDEIAESGSHDAIHARVTV